MIRRLWNILIDAATRPASQDKELEQYRGLMTPPGKFADGFTWKTVAGAIFLGFIMMPGSMYLSLVVGSGGSINSAAQWVTIILFAEVARRSFKDLRMQEVYILFYMAGIAMGSPFSGLLWNQYLVQSDFAQATGIAQGIPSWVAPAAEQIRRDGPTFFTKAWLAPIAMIMIGLVVGNISNFGLGYVLYRLTSDVEKLPFPMAPVGASGITALVSSRDEKEGWRWRCFAIGAKIGLIFGAIYIGVPVITGVLLPKPIQLIPIPWIDLTASLGRILPATPLNITMDIGSFIVGMLLPFWAVAGGFIGVVLTMVFNPILHSYGILSTWKPGMDFVDTSFSNNMDFYLSFGAGLTVAVAVVSIGRIFLPMLKSIGGDRHTTADRARSHAGGAQSASAWRRLITNNVERGDFSIFIALGIYVATSATWIGLSAWLIEGFPWWFFVFYAAVYTPLISYATAKLEGMCGQAVDLPMVREATYILSGYHGVKIWFAPAPIANWGAQTAGFRVMELTGTRIGSMIKTLIVVLPVIMVSSLVFSQLLWQMNPVPSDAYPYAQKMWELQAKNACLVYSSTLEGGSQFIESWKWGCFGSGVVGGTVSFVLLSVAGLPTLLAFGLIRGLGQSSLGGIFLEMLGALVGRYYFRKRFGDMWLKYVPVLFAGFSCGIGLIAMASMAIAILKRMTSPLMF